MKNNFIRFFIAALSLFGATGVYAHDFEVDGIYYNITDATANTVEVTYRGRYTNEYSDEYSGSVTIPSTVTYDGVTYSVTSIKSYAFYNCSGLTSIIIPNSVTSIGGVAFSGCTGLTSVTIPNSVTSIGYSAFENCTGLTSVTIPNNVTSIGESTFRGCTRLTSITIPNNVTSIGREAFYACTGLTSIEIPNRVTSIGGNAFSGCTGLTSIVVASSNTVYDSRNECDAIIETATNTIIAGCKNTTITNTVTGIGDNAFYKCTGLTSVTIPNSVTSIGGSAFHSCSGLTSITIPNSVTSIGSGTFYNCSGLTSVTIPNSVTSIGRETFRNCSELTSIVVASGNTVYDSRNECDAIIETATNTIIAGCKNTVIPNSVTSIGYGAFDGCSGLISVTIPNSVTNIEYFAFFGCSGLTSIISNIPADKLFTIDSYVFDGVDKTACTLYVPAGAKDTYAATAAWNEFTNIVEMDETAIEGVTMDGAPAEGSIIYTLDGRRVSDAPAPGIYIVNGRKVVIK